MTAAETPAGPPFRVREVFVAGVAFALFAAMVGLVLASAGATLGYDYTCYTGAARDLVAGRSIYDNAFSIGVGTCPGTYTYPPPFALAMVPWLLFGDATWPWCLSMAACFLAGLAILPVRRDIRLALLVVAAFDWPLLYAIKLGQVEPILFLGFAATWRWLDRPGVVGFATAVGALVKVQPALVAVWAWTSRRCGATWQAIAWTLAIGGLATLATGPSAWASYADLLRGMSGTFAAAHNFAPGAVAHLAGATDAAASSVQWISVGVAAAAVVVAWRRLPPVASLLATIVASQLLSSPLRDHYAALLLLPTAWLLSRGRWWAVAFPLAGWLALGAGGEGGSPIAAAVVPLAFFGCLAAILVEGWRDRSDGAAVPGCAVPARAGG
jgi:hypothetical protein